MAQTRVLSSDRVAPSPLQTPDLVVLHTLLENLTTAIPSRIPVVIDPEAPFGLEWSASINALSQVQATNAL